MTIDEVLQKMRERTAETEAEIIRQHRQSAARLDARMDALTAWRDSGFVGPCPEPQD